MDQPIEGGLMLEAARGAIAFAEGKKITDNPNISQASRFGWDDGWRYAEHEASIACRPVALVAELANAESCAPKRKAHDGDI